jgi:RimJ/RimL family protein N-acetyltransferase
VHSDILKLETESYNLRLLEECDLDFYLALYMDEKLMSLVGRFEDQSLLVRSFDKTVTFNQQSPFSRLTYCIYRSDERIGITSLIRANKNKAQCEIGTIVKTDFLNNGVACEIMQCLIDLAFTKLEISQVYADFSMKNHAAHKLVKKLGFTVVDGENDFYHCFVENNN